MSTVIDQNLRTHAEHPMDSLVTNVAANDDHLPGAERTMHSTSESGGWNAYDVWRRLIKDARDRREATGKFKLPV